jgi:hypothetical protein
VERDQLGSGQIETPTVDQTADGEWFDPKVEILEEALRKHAESYHW